MEIKEKKSETKHKTIFIKRTFDLPIATLWKAWTEPESFKKWWGPKDYTCPFCTIDLKVGGKYLASMKGKDGTEIYSTGTFKEIFPQKKLVMTDNFSDSKGNIIPPPANMPGDWSEKLIITVQLEDINGKTILNLMHEGMPVEAYDDCVKGWQESFDKLEPNFKTAK